LSKSNDEHEDGRVGGVQPSGPPLSAVASGFGVDLDVSWLVPSDLDAIDALARLQVVVSRCGGSLRLHGADGGLAELLEFVGLSNVMHLCPCRGGGCSAALAGPVEWPPF